MNHPNKVYINRQFNCSAADLFRWLVEPQLIAQWFGPKHLTVGQIKAQLEIGVQFSIELKKPNGQHFFLEGEYLEIQPPAFLSFSFHYSGLSPAPPDSIVKIQLEELSPHKSQLLLIQEFESVPQDMPSRTAAWQQMMEKLTQLAK